MDSTALYGVGPVKLGDAPNKSIALVVAAVVTTTQTGARPTLQMVSETLAVTGANAMKWGNKALALLCLDVSNGLQGVLDAAVERKHLTVTFMARPSQ